MILGGKEYKDNRVTDEIRSIEACMKRAQEKNRIDYIYKHGDQLDIDSFTLSEIRDLQTSLKPFRVDKSVESYKKIEGKLAAKFGLTMTPEFKKAFGEAIAKSSSKIKFSIMDLATMYDITTSGKNREAFELLCRAVIIMQCGIDGAQVPDELFNELRFTYISSRREYLMSHSEGAESIGKDSDFNVYNKYLNIEIDAQNRFIKYILESRYEEAYGLIADCVSGLFEES